MAVVTLSLQAKLNVFETACMQTRLVDNTIQNDASASFMREIAVYSNNSHCILTHDDYYYYYYYC